VTHLVRNWDEPKERVAALHALSAYVGLNETTTGLVAKLALSDPSADVRNTASALLAGSGSFSRRVWEQSDASLNRVGVALLVSSRDPLTRGLERFAGSLAWAHVELLSTQSVLKYWEEKGSCYWGWTPKSSDRGGPVSWEDRLGGGRLGSALGL
jgi:hypothetical protein